MPEKKRKQGESEITYLDSVQLPGTPGTEEFLEELSKALYPDESSEHQKPNKLRRFNSLLGGGISAAKNRDDEERFNTPYPEVCTNPLIEPTALRSTADDSQTTADDSQTLVITFRQQMRDEMRDELNANERPNPRVT